MHLSDILLVVAHVEVATGIERSHPALQGTVDRMLAGLTPEDREVACRYMAIKEVAIREAAARIQAVARR